MQEVFEKIIEKLEEKIVVTWKHDYEGGREDAFNEAIEIVKQEAEQYQSSEIGFISKTEVLKLIEEIKCNDDIPKNYGTLLDIMRMIRNMPTVDNTDNGWIPCNELLPAYGQTVLASVCAEDAEWKIIIACYKEEDFWLDGKIDAWQPLPTPYAKGE